MDWNSKAKVRDSLKLSHYCGCGCLSPLKCLDECALFLFLTFFCNLYFLALQRHKRIKKRHKSERRNRGERKSGGGRVRMTCTRLSFSIAYNYGVRNAIRGRDKHLHLWPTRFLLLIQIEAESRRVLGVSLPDSLHLAADFMRDHASAFLTLTSKPDWFLHASLFRFIVSIDYLYSGSAKWKKKPGMKC